METPSPEQVAKAFYHLFHVPMARALGDFGEYERRVIERDGRKVCIPGSALGVCARDTSFGHSMPSFDETDMGNRQMLGIFPDQPKFTGRIASLYRRIRGEKAVPGVRF